MESRLAAIDGVGGDTGVKPQHRLRHLPTAAPSLIVIFFFFYSNKNHLVQLEDTTIKTERGCSMQHTERTTVAHHRSDLFYHTWGEWVKLTDFSSAFNTIIPQQLIHKLVQLGLNTSLCNWLLDFLTGRPQAVRVGSNTSSTITLNTGAPQGCVLSPLLFTLLTHDCTPSNNSNLFIKFADDTTVVGLISNRDESNYRSKVSRNDHQWPSMVRLWREWAAPSSWVYTSQRTSPGLTTLQHWPRKHSSISTSSANSEEPEPRPPSCAPSTEAPSRASWLAASLCGMAPATRPAASPFNG